MKSLLNLLKLFIVLLCGMLLAAPTSAATKVALVIGNAAYSSAPLKNSVNDAELIASTLQRLGFDVKLERNVNQKSFQRALRDFGARSKGAELAFFYYAGHGVQEEGENWLVPVGAQIDKPGDISIEAVGVNGVMRELQNSGAKYKVVVLDACRDNPFISAERGSSHRGLARMDAPGGTLVAFATAPGSTARDGDGRNGLYTGELVRYLVDPSLDLKEAFDRAGAAVAQASGGKQLPRKDDGIYDKIYLAGHAPAAGKPEAPQPAAVASIDAALAGQWEGYYRYDANKSVPVKFMLDAAVSGSRFYGKISEPNTFGDKQEAFLYANFEGAITGNTVTFVKTYDGSGGQHHSIQYRGVLDRASGVIRGQWVIQNTTGTFEVKLRK
ncbi:caspase family protein [Andreprevotia chitinilytica]|uniref:caspase family protein n=1 Tax=Andreprevotia chitinilytica TaxID=396808 RepID=UPI00068F4226|nr:caspase family protein [Andreprevotia chitinilytica]